MDWMKIIIETISESFSSLLTVAYIVIPILIAIECLKDAGWLEKFSAKCEGFTKFLKLPGESALGLMVGIFIGLTFGSGVILKIKEDVKMTKTQLNVLFIFVGVCHAVVEETALFTAVGAYGSVLVISRIVVALIFCFSYIWIVKRFEGLKGKSNSSSLEY